MKENQYCKVFFPQVLEKAQEIRSEQIKFVHYTSAEAAMSIIKNKEVWLRNTMYMNDYSEVEHGIKCLIQSLKMKEGKNFRAYINQMFPGIFNELVRKFADRMLGFGLKTYIICVSEHHSSDDLYGRLSMWRGYGGKNPVALVFDPNPLLGDPEVFKTFLYPVDYVDPENFGTTIDKLRERLEANSDFILDLGRNKVGGALFSVFRAIAICTKHPGFSEEREWRIAYNPTFELSDRIIQETEVINDISQEVCKISLKKFPEDNFFSETILDCFDKIIIGPTDQQLFTGKAFEKILKEAGFEDVEDRIRYSGIPLR